MEQSTLGSRGESGNFSSTLIGKFLVVAMAACLPATTLAIEIDKTGPATAAGGSQLQYLLTLTNPGPAQADVVVIDTLPNGFAFDSAAGVDWDCGSAGDPVVVTCARDGDLPAGESSLTLTVDAPLPATDELVSNQASVEVAATETDSDSHDTLLHAAVLEVTKLIDDGAAGATALDVPAGDDVTFLIQIENLGPAIAESIVVRDLIPDGFVIEASPPGGFGDGWDCSVTGATQEIICEYDTDLVVGESSSVLEISAETPVVEDVFANQAAARSAATISGYPHESGEVEVTLFFEADLRVEKTALPSVVYSGDAVTYSYLITNFGPHTASGIRLVDAFDRASAIDSVVEVADEEWTCQLVVAPPAGSTVVDCLLDSDTLAPGAQSLTLDLIVTPAAVDEEVELTNIATVTSDQALPPNPDNVSDPVTVTLQPSADLSLTRQGLPTEPVDAESDFAWQLLVANGGPSKAVDLVVSEQLPEGVLVTGFTGAWDCLANQRQGSFRCTLGELVAGADSSLGVQARAPRNPPQPGQVTASAVFGQAEVSSAVHDPDEDNNAAQPSSVDIAARWNLALLKSSDRDIVAPDQAFSYSIEIDNFGPSDLVGDLRPLLSDLFDPRLGGVLNVCTVREAPCWSCDWRQRPAFQQGIATGTGSLAGLGGAWSLALAPDLEQVYLGGRYDDAVAVFDRAMARDGQFGELDYAGFGAVDAPRALAMHPSGEWLAVAEAGNSARLAILARSPVDGSLSLAHTLAGPYDQPAALTFSPDGRTLYLAESGADRIVGLSFDAKNGLPSTGSLVERTAGGSNPLLLGGVAGLELSADGLFLYAAAPDDHSVVAFSVDASSGHLTPLDTASLQLQNSTGPVPVHAVAVGDNALYAGGGDTVFVIGRNGGTGAPGGYSAIVAGGEPPRRLQGVSALALSSDGDALFVAAAQDGAISLIQRNTSGVMAFARSVVLPDGLQANDLVLDSGGERLYVSATSDPVAGGEEPGASAVLTYYASGSSACGDHRRGDIVNGHIDDVALNVPAGQGLTVTVHAVVNSGTPNGSIVPNIAFLEAPLGYGEDPSDDRTLESGWDVEARNVTEIIASTSAPGQRPVPGEAFEFTVDIVNNGPSAVSGLSVTDHLPTFPDSPAGFVQGTVEWQCSASEGACCNPGSSNCGLLQPTDYIAGGLNGHLVDIGAQSSLALTLRGRLHPGAEPEAILTNQVELAMPDGIEAVDEEDLTDTHNVQISAEADAWISKESLGPGEDGDGLHVEYRLLVGNYGPSAIQGLRVRDLFENEHLSSAGAVWSCDITEPGEVLVDSCCAFGGGSCQITDLSNQSGVIDQVMALAPQGEARFLIRVPVIDEEADEVTNTAELLLPTGVDDANLDNNSQVRVTRMLATAELEITKTILAGDQVVPGEEVQFLITVTNAGPDGVPVTVEDLFGPELDNVAWSCDATTPIPGDLVYDTVIGLGDDLADASAVVTSVDGRHVYALAGGVAGEGEDALPGSVAVFERNIVPGPDFGELTFIELEIDGVDDADDSGLAVEGLAGGRAMALSPDQRHLYIAAADASAVTVFRREHVPGSADYGRLVFVQSRAQGSQEPADVVSPVAGLLGASDVKVSADGEHVYVVGRGEHAVAVFRRNQATGTLAFQGEVNAFDLGVGDRMWGASAIEIAPNDIDLYVTGAGLEAGFSGPDWTKVQYDTTTFEQTYFVNNTAGVDLKWLQQEQSQPLPDYQALYLRFDHRHRFDAPYGCYDVGVLQYSPDGGENWFHAVEHGGVFTTGGYNGVQNGFESNPLPGVGGWCNSSPAYDQGFAAVELDLSAIGEIEDSILFRFGLAEGSAVGGDGWWIDNIRIVAVVDGDEVTLLEDRVETSGSGGSVTHFKRQNDDAAVGFGNLTRVPDDLDPLPSVDVSAMDAGGANLYVGSGSEGVLVVLGRDPATGGLTRLQTIDPQNEPVDGIDTTALAGLADLAISGDGEHVIAAASVSDRLVVFRRQPFAGTLSAMQVVAPGPGPGDAEDGIVGVRSVAVSPDGRQAFTVADEGQLGIFERLAPDPTYGFLEAVIDGQDDGFGQEASGLLGARGAALSGNGKWLYVAGFGQVGSGQRGSLVVLERDSGSTESGQHLRFRQAFRDLEGGVDGLDGALDVVAVRTQDGNFEDIYVASERDSAIAHFRQDLSTGEVAFESSYRNGQGGLTGLAGAAAVTASPNGNLLFVAGRFDHAVVVLSRDPVTGTLSQVGEARDGVGGVSGMLGANALVMSRDGAHLYVAARQSDSIVVFAHDAGMLSWRQTFYDGTEGAVLTSPTGIDITYDSGGGEHVIASSLDGDAVTVLRRETDPGLESLYGRVRFQQSLVNGSPGIDALQSPRGVVVDPANDRVYVVADDSNALLVFDRNTSASGGQFGMLNLLETRRQGVGGVIGMNRPYALAVSRGARRNIYTASLGSQSVAAFVRRAGSSCAASGAGHLSEEVFIAADGTIRFTVSALVDPAAIGELTNTATLVVGDDVTNLGEEDSAESEVRQLTPISDLQVSKDNARLSIVAGEREHYRISVVNDGPSHARDVTISDLLSANDQFNETTAAWTCRAVGAGLLQRGGSLMGSEGPSAALAGTSALAWSPAPAAQLAPRLYATGLLGNAVTAMSVDPVSGQLVIFDQLIEGGIDAAGQAVTGLRGARDVVVSSDGAHIYIASQVDDRLLVLVPELGDPDAPEFGRLRLIESHGPDTPGLEAFDQPRGLALSADGENLYVAAASSSAIYVFDRDTATGHLSLRQVIDSAAVPGLAGVVHVAIAPEDEHLYAAGAGAGAVVAFSRAADGSLVPIQTRSSAAIPGLSGANALAFSPDGDHLYVSGEDADAIVVFGRDNDSDSGQFGRLDSGTVQVLDDVNSLLGPRAVAVSADGGSVYVAAFESSALLIFRRDRVDGTLSLVSRQIDGSGQAGLAGLSSLAFNGSGSMLYTGAVLDGAVTAFDRSVFSNCSEDSGVGDVALQVDIAAGGEILIDLEVDIVAATEGQDCPAPLDPARRCVVNTVSVDWNEHGGARSATAMDASFVDRAALLTIDKTDGLAQFRGLADAVALDGAGSADDEGHVYVASPGEPGIGVYSLAGSSGPTGSSPLSFEQLVLNGTGQVSQLNGIADVVVSPDGSHVYAVSSLDSAIVAFERNLQSGHLDWLATYSNNSSGIVGLSGARSLVIDSSGRHLYAAGTNANAVVVFDRQNDPDEPGFGELAYLGLSQNGTDGVVDMQRPVHLALSPDDRHLYAAATQSDAVVVFSRNIDDGDSGYGLLEWRQSRRNLIGDVSGLLDVSRVLVSPDGASLYAAGTGNNALVRFERNTASGSANFGRLSIAEVHVDGVGGVAGLAGVRGLRLAGGTSQWLLAASPQPGSIALFERSAADGSLQFVQVIEDGDEAGTGGPVSGLAGARAVWALPGEDRVLVAGAQADALAVFDLGGGSPEFEGAMVQGGGGAVPGEAIDYLITVRNEGPSRVEGARVTDFFPPVFESVSWSCQVVGSLASTCPSGIFSGNVDAVINLAAGESVIIEASGLLRADASGQIVNEARVELPAGVFDLSGGDNVAVDDDTTVNTRSDLRVEFEGLPVEVVAGAAFNLRVVVHNDGPGALAGNTVTLNLPEAVVIDDWMCQPSVEPGLLGPVDEYEDDFEIMRAVAVSHDGRHLYAAGEKAGSDGLFVFDRNTLTGELALRQQLFNLTVPDGGAVIDGLAGARDVLVSPDDAHVYVAGYADDAVAAFERDGATGRLVYIGVIRDDIGAVDGLAGARSLAMSADGGDLYVAGELDSAIAVLGRDAASGLLSFRQVRRNQQQGITRLSQPVDLLLLDGDTRLWVASPQSNAVVRFERQADGLLAHQGHFEQGGPDGAGGTLDGLTGVRSLALRNDGALLALSRSASDHALTLFDRPTDEAIGVRALIRDGDLVGTPAATVAGLADADRIVVDGVRGVIYAAGRDDVGGQRTVAALVEDPDRNEMQFLGLFAGGDAASATDASVVLSPDGRQLYLVGGDSIDGFRVLAGSACSRLGGARLNDRVDLVAGGQVAYDLNARVLSNARGAFELAAGVQPATAAADPNVANNLAVEQVQIRAEAALATSKQRQTDPVVAGEDVGWEISVTNAGPSSIQDISVNDLLPTLPGNVPAPGAAGVIAGSAEWMCSGEAPLAIGHVHSDVSTAALRAMALSDDGLWAVSAGSTAGQLDLYERDPLSGALTLVDSLADGDEILDENEEPVGVVSGLTGATDAAFSGDGRHVYVVSGSGNSITQFSIDSVQGLLGFVAGWSNGENGIIALNEPLRVIRGPADDRLYVAARGSSAVTVFARDPVSGGLQWMQSMRSGIGLPLNVLDGVRDLVISPDAAHLYAAAAEQHAVVIFGLNGEGELAYLDRVANGDSQGNLTVVGLGLVQSLAISPQGRHLYAASLADDSVTILHRDAHSGALVWFNQIRNGFEVAEGLDGASAVVLGRDGEQVHVGARNDGGVMVFDRRWSDGMLVAIERLEDAGLEGVRRMVGDASGLLAATESGAGALVSLEFGPAGFCGTGTGSGDELFDVVSLAAGATVRYSLTATVHPGARGLLENTAGAELPTDVVALTPEAHDDTDSAPIAVVTDLDVVKTISGDTSALVAGGPVGFTIDVGNSGPSHAFSARVEDLLPAVIGSATWTCETIPVTSAGSWCDTGGSGSVDELVDVLRGERLLIQIEGLIDPGYTGQLSNTATAHEPLDGSDPDVDNNVSTVSGTVNTVADIAVSKSVSVGSASPGDVVTFEVEISNIGPSDAPSVTVTDVPPAGLSFTSWSCTASDGSCGANSGSGAIAQSVSIDSGGVVSFEVEALIDPAVVVPATLTNVAHAELGGDGSDPVAGNESDSAAVEVGAAVADVFVVKSVDAVNAMPGDALEYQIVVGNDGPGLADAVLIQDVLPAGLQSVSWVCQGFSGAACAEASGSGDIDMTVSIPVGGSLEFVLGAVIDPGLPSGPDQLLTNVATATVVGDSTDPEPANNSDSATTVLDLDAIFRDRFQIPQNQQETP